MDDNLDKDTKKEFERWATREGENLAKAIRFPGDVSFDFYAIARTAEMYRIWCESRMAYGYVSELIRKIHALEGEIEHLKEDAYGENKMKTPEPQGTIWDDSGDFWVIESVADGIAYAQRMFDDKLISRTYAVHLLNWTNRFGGTWLTVTA